MSVHPSETLKAKAAEIGCGITDKALAEKMDDEDPLKGYRDEFRIPKKNGKDIVYLCGNSLGLQHKGVKDSVVEHLDKWGEQAVEGHFKQPCPWFEIDDIVRGAMATVVGAKREEVVVMNTLTVNLHLLLAAFYNPQGARRKILIEKNPFPSDMYAIRSQIRLKGCDPDEDLLEVGSDDEVRCFPEQKILDIIEARGDEIAVVMFAGVHFLTGQFFNLEAITKAAKKKGCVVGFDLAHAVGNCPLYLHDWGVDFACWCTYKYINAGPGNIGGAFVHESVDTNKLTRLEGWWGHKRETRFKLKHDFDGTDGVASFQLSNPGVVNMASIKPCLDLFEKIGMGPLRAKSLLLTGYLEMLLKELLPDSIEILTPSDIDRRGCQLSVRVKSDLVSDRTSAAEYECGTNTNNKASILQAQMEEAGITCDNRPPDILRLPPVPLYNTFHDVYTLVTTLKALVK
eukprot:TRINITY_DN10172_c0_g1_i1.p1 TRINITY_DN10172_c0_g1~~TRINITY_DN10172_c0_g1_i1.p1  ORF type:complete len:456 (+),score=131.55 TRINITY_DN10172_c0_g1_i1:55-1422(+)